MNISLFISQYILTSVLSNPAPHNPSVLVVEVKSRLAAPKSSRMSDPPSVSSGQNQARKIVGTSFQ